MAWCENIDNIAGDRYTFESHLSPVMLLGALGQVGDDDGRPWIAGQAGQVGLRYRRQEIMDSGASGASGV